MQFMTSLTQTDTHVSPINKLGLCTKNILHTVITVPHTNTSLPWNYDIKKPPHQEH